jgi:hypothetical protein
MTVGEQYDPTIPVACGAITALGLAGRTLTFRAEGSPCPLISQTRSGT